MEPKEIFYMCPVCFEVSKEPRRHHGREMVSCCAGEPGSYLRKPMTDENGQMVSRAPVWYMEAMGWIPDWTPLDK